ncbi:MAG TPA: low temperature requirement protein A [Candidatus Limnocylindrales bacterium]|nr:low temperature requirement protein A [Candidatus Limnocylindrales bacterium]
MRAPRPQGVAFVELFFDLVFVFAVTQLTAQTAHDLTPDGVLRSILVGWLIWWAWTQFTWTLNPADTTRDRVRVITLAATAAAFVMAASVPRAFTDEALWFAVPYLVVRLLGLGLQVLVEMERHGADHAAVYRWAGASLIGLVLVLIGALVEPGLRSVVWLGAIGADFAAATVAGRAATWDLNVAHLTERHGLFVIIALGESLIVAGAAIAGAQLTSGLVLSVGAAIVVACLLWWTYFGWLKDALEHHFASAGPDQLGPLARDAFSFAHFPLVCGIVGFAVAVEETVAHPDDPMTGPVLAALGFGVALFVASSALSLWRLGGPVLVVRLAALAVMAVALVMVAAITPPPVVPLGTVAIVLLGIVVFEAVAPPDNRPAS